MSGRPPVFQSRRALIAAARQPTILAFLVALGVTLLLALLVLGPWATDGTADSNQDATRLAAIDEPPLGPTPTPRALRPASQRAASPVASPSADAAGSPAAASADDDENRPSIKPRPSRDDDKPTAVGNSSASPKPPKPPARPTATARPPSPTPRPDPTPTPEPTPVYEASSVPELTTLTSGSWTIAEGQLVSGGPQNAEPWVVIPQAPPRGDYAVEGEFRVRDLAPNVCAQSFGVVAGNPSRTMWGGGIFYPCQESTPRARVTDVTNAGDGYNGDSELASERFELDAGWHTFRLELRGDEANLLIDGDEVASATIDRSSLGTGDQVGFWSQGVRVGIRRIAVYQLADSQ